VIGAELWAQIRSEAALGARIAFASDPLLERVKVVAD
jgi:hypothetical protein